MSTGSATGCVASKTTSESCHLPSRQRSLQPLSIRRLLSCSLRDRRCSPRLERRPPHNKARDAYTRVSLIMLGAHADRQRYRLRSEQDNRRLLPLAVAPAQSTPAEQPSLVVLLATHPVTLPVDMRAQ